MTETPYLFPMSEDGGARTATRVSGVTDARLVAAEICGDLRRGELLDGAFDRQTTRLDPRDRRFTRELVYGMLRRRGWLDALLEARVRGGLSRLDADVHDLLRLGAYQLLQMRSVPAYAAIAQTVELAKRRHGVGPSRLANAVLRRLDREQDALQADMPADPIDALALVESHPRWLVARWVSRWGRGGDAPPAAGEQHRAAAGGASGPRGSRAGGSDARGRGHHGRGCATGRR